MTAPTVWQSTPLRSKIVFLLAVFFVFVGIAVANDVIDSGRMPLQRYAVGAVLTGSFAIVYAASGVALRRKSWIVFVPLIVVQFFCMGALAHWLPDQPAQPQLNAAATASLRNRMVLDGSLIILCVSLGYTGFVFTSISVGRRYMQSQLEKASLQSEMTAAREVQQLMVPDRLPSVIGYAIDSIYRPASEVGGDFFQVIPLKSGRTLVVVGDVSGKGLRAAMFVSMIVGMLRTVTDFTEDPAEILGELNRRLFGRTQGAFATCLVVRLGEHGQLALANAGHPAPYLNGIEIPFAGSLPLGLMEHVDYAGTRLEMQAGDRAVLMTDGIAEARNQQNMLLGFPRVERMLRDGATVKVVAEAAQQHGQEDDLTVIGIARTA